jgi:hypothetical protein
MTLRTKWHGLMSLRSKAAYGDANITNDPETAAGQASTTAPGLGGTRRILRFHRQRAKCHLECFARRDQQLRRQVYTEGKRNDRLESVVEQLTRTGELQFKRIAQV